MRHEGDLQMPPRSKKLHDDIIADFVRWIDMGAADPRAGKVVAAKTIDIEKGRMFWSFQPLVKATPPAVKNQDWVRTPRGSLHPGQTRREQFDAQWPGQP